MKSRPHISSLAAAALAPLLFMATSRATVISLTPANQDVLLGSSFNLELRISGLGDHASPALGAFDLDVNFNPVLAQFDSFTFGDPVLGDQLGPIIGSFTDSSLNSPGSLNAFGFSLDLPGDLVAGQPSEFALGTLRFTSLAPGNATFDLANIILGDENGSPLQFDSPLGANVRITSSSVPENGGFLAALALLGIVVTHRFLTRRQSL